MKKKINILCMVFFSLTISYFLFDATGGDAATGYSENIAALWAFDEGAGNIAKDTSGNEIHGEINGATWAHGVHNEALKFDGIDDYITIPDSPLLNTGGPYTDRTIIAIFKVDDSLTTIQKQTIYEEGGRVGGFNIYVFNGSVYAGAWNRAGSYKWDGAWLSKDIQSNKWYCVALVIRNGKDKVEKRRFEMWLDGKLVDRKPGCAVNKHASGIGIGAVIKGTVFHDNDGNGTRVHNIRGDIDQIRVYNAALSKKDLKLGVYFISG